MKSNNYIVIQGWMVNELKLKGNDLILFSIIYGFSQDKNSEFTGSLNYLCESLSCTRNTAIKSIKRLLESKYIIKKQVVVSNVTFNKYSVNDGVVQKLTLGSAKVDIGVVQKMHGGSAKNAPNITINNTNINNTNNTTSAKADGIDFDLLLKFINKKTKRQFKKINSTVRAKYNARLKDGYTKADIFRAVEQSVKEDYNIKNNFKYLKPEYYSRANTLDLFAETTTNAGLSIKERTAHIRNNVKNSL